MSTPLSPLNVTITIDDSNGVSSFHSPEAITPPAGPPNPAFKPNYIYCTPPPLSLKNDADLTHYLDATTTTPLPSFPPGGGSIWTVLDFAPNPEGKPGRLHRTKTLDYIYVTDGELELTLDSGEKRIFRKGDMIVQRASTHAWRNMSATESARMTCVLLGTEGAPAGAIEFLQ